MLRLEVRVDERRDRAGFATLFDGWRRLAAGAAAASAARALAAQHGNPACDPLRRWGDPPFGRYVLLLTAPVPRGAENEYGGRLLVFEARSGPALEAESYGRLALLAYAGATGRDGCLRATQGGLRLPETILTQIVQRIGGSLDLELRIAPAGRPAWWQFWKREPVSAALSAELPRLVEPPLDEWSLLDELLRNAIRRRPQARRDDGPDTSSDSDSPSRGGDGDTPVQGRGGEFSGAGASGSWDTGGAVASRPSGVDASGRIVAGAVAGAAGIAAAQVAATHALGPQGDSVAADEDAAGAVDQASADAPESSATGTESGTAY